MSTIDISALESWLRDTPRSVPVGAWTVQGLDLWPLFTTCLVSLAILSKIGQRRSLARVGSAAWQLGVLADHTVVSAARRLGAKPAPELPVDPLDTCILYSGSRVHTRSVGSILVTAPLDIPATLMLRAGHRNVFWFEDMPTDDPRLSTVLNGPARGVAGLLAIARSRASHIKVAAELRNLPGFASWCASAAAFLRLSPRFLQLWLARQLKLALATMRCYGEVFDARGRPRLLVMLNGGFASTVGLTAAARTRGIPVIEVQHGADSECAVTSADHQPHFSTYNTAPDALISWEMRPRPDPAVLAMGPIGLHLPASVEQPHTRDGPGHIALRAAFGAQRQALATRSQAAGAQREVLVSLQPQDQGDWVETIARQMGPGVFFWLRRHGADLNGKAALPGTWDGSIFDVPLASSCALPELLARAEVHLTRFSAVALEAAALGVPTIAVEAYAHRLYSRSIPAPLLWVEPDLGRAAHRLGQLLDGPSPQATATLPATALMRPFMEAMLKPRP